MTIEVTIQVPDIDDADVLRENLVRLEAEARETGKRAMRQALSDLRAVEAAAQSVASLLDSAADFLALARRVPGLLSEVNQGAQYGARALCKTVEDTQASARRIASDLSLQLDDLDRGDDADG